MFFFVSAIWHSHHEQLDHECRYALESTSFESKRTSERWQPSCNQICRRSWHYWSFWFDCARCFFIFAYLNYELFLLLTLIGLQSLQQTMTDLLSFTITWCVDRWPSNFRRFAKKTVGACVHERLRDRLNGQIFWDCLMTTQECIRATKCLFVHEQLFDAIFTSTTFFLVARFAAILAARCTPSQLWSQWYFAWKGNKKN